MSRLDSGPSPMRGCPGGIAGLALLALAGCASMHGTAAGPEPPAGRESALVWSSDSAVVGGLGARGTVFAYDGATGRELWHFRIERALFPGLPSHAMVERLRFLPEGRGAVLTANGDLWSWNAADHRGRRLTTTGAPDRDAEPSPNGDQVAFVRGGDLYAIDLGTGEETRLTSHGELGELVSPDDSLPRFLWAPESRRIAFRFAGPGGGIGVAALPSQTVVRLETGGEAAGRALSVSWRPDGRAVGLERLSADGARVEILLCHPEKLYCRPLATRPAPPGARASLQFLSDGFLWGESAGTGIGRYDTVGRETGALLASGWRLRDLLRVDDEESWAIATADSATLPAHTATMAVRIDGPPMMRLLAPQRVLAAAIFAPTRSRWVRLEKGTPTLVSLEGGRVAALPGLRPLAGEN